MKKGAVFWVDKVTKIEEQPDMSCRITFTIVSPTDGEIWENEMALPPEAWSKLRNATLTA